MNYDVMLEKFGLPTYGTEDEKRVRLERNGILPKKHKTEVKSEVADGMTEDEGKAVAEPRKFGRPKKVK